MNLYRVWEKLFGDHERRIRRSGTRFLEDKATGGDNAIRNCAWERGAYKGEKKGVRKTNERICKRGEGL